MFLLKRTKSYTFLPRSYKLPGLVLEVGDGKLKHDLKGKLKCMWVIMCKILIMIHKPVSFGSFSFSFILVITLLFRMEYRKMMKTDPEAL